jgi:hypothetical protein
MLKSAEQQTINSRVGGINFAAGLYDNVHAQIMTFATDDESMGLVNYNQIECSSNFAIFPPTTSFLLSLPWAILHRIAHWRLIANNSSNCIKIDYPKTRSWMGRTAPDACSQAGIALR